MALACRGATESTFGYVDGPGEGEMSVYLEKIDPAQNCFRFYELRIEPDLFAESALVVHWGRIGHPGRTAVRGSGRVGDVERKAESICKMRLRRGYRVA